MSPTRQRIIFYGSTLLLLVAATSYFTVMPKQSFRGKLPEACPAIHAREGELFAYVSILSESIGCRPAGAPSLASARDTIKKELEGIGQGSVRLEALGPAGANSENVILELPGRGSELVIVGAHYDTVPESPGANDNGSGVAMGLVLAKHLAPFPRHRALRFVFFANEEPPYFQNEGMGSLLHARESAERHESVSAMIALDSVGNYLDEEGSQHYPWPLGALYPSQGDFVAFVGNLGSRSLVRRAVGIFRETTAFPSEGAALPSWLPGVGWSDHWSFWQVGIPAIMVTDTALFRDPSYHQPSDLPKHLNYERMARVELGLEEVVKGLVAGPDR